jgi:CIC family chloride channel protein
MQLQSLELNGWMLIAFLMLAWVLKPVLTGMTLGAGGVAGVFAPAIFCGALLGHQFAIVTEWINSSFALPMGHAVLAGLAGMLAGVLHAPLTAILLTAEVSGGYALFVPVMLTSAISFRLSKRWMKYTVYTRELAERGELLTHDKDQTILTLMNLMDQVESDHEVVNPHWTLGQLIPILERSSHDVFPVLDRNGHLLGLIELQEIREVMFDRELYDTMHVHEMMNIPAASIDVSMRMEKVMAIFERTGAWRLPVLSGNKFKGFVSRTKLLANYRNWLKASSIE